MEKYSDKDNNVSENEGLKEIIISTPDNNETVAAFLELGKGVYAALETYSNVNRGNGHKSMVTTHLYGQAKSTILEYLGLNKRGYVVIICTFRGAAILMKQIKPESYRVVTSKEIGLSLGIWALAVKRKALPEGAPFLTGGGTTKLVSKSWIIWADAPDLFEAGTPPIINVIAFAKALRMIQKAGKNLFLGATNNTLTPTGIVLHHDLDKYSGRELLHELKITQIGRGILVPTREGMLPFINMDNSASTPTFAPIWNSFLQNWHPQGHDKQEVILQGKAICADLLGAPLNSYDVIFTSNTTEAINLVAESISHESVEEAGTVVLSTLFEHSSNDIPWRMVPNTSVIRLSLDSDGFLDLNEMELFLSEYNLQGMYGKKRIKLVAVSGASNVLGVCNNLSEISRLVHKYGAQLLVDAAQLIAHRKVDMESSGIDYLAFSAHKVYAPFGSGALVARKGLLNFSPDEWEQIQASGEENSGGIAALVKSLELLQRIGMDVIREEEQALTRHLLQSLLQLPKIKVHGLKNTEAPNFDHKLGVIVFEIKGMMANQLADELAVRSGIGVRSGCHCAHIIIKHLLGISPGLEQFQKLIITLFPKVKLPGLLRVSLGIENSKEEIDTLIQTLDSISQNPRTSSPKMGNGMIQLSKAKVKMQMNDFVKECAIKVFY